MGNAIAIETENDTPVNRSPVITKKQYNIVNINIPYSKLSMIRTLQQNFDYEVKGTIYVDHDHKFISFEVRTDNSEIYSYGASDWHISFHTHPDNTSQKYGVRYFSPPSVDDVLEIYEHSMQFVPETAAGGCGELSIIFANEGIYLLQVDRDNFEKFNKDNLPFEVLEEILNQTLTEFMTNFVKKGITDTINGDYRRYNSKPKPRITKKERNRKSLPKPIVRKKAVINMNNPDIDLNQYARILKDLSSQTTDDFGFSMTFYPWLELQETGLNLKIYDYFLKKKVND